MCLVNLPGVKQPGCSWSGLFGLSRAPDARAATFFTLLCIASLLPLQEASAEPLSLSLGEGQVIPEITFSYVGDDNVFASRQNQQEASGFLVEPRIRYVADKRENELALTYNGEYLNSEESRVSYADHRLQLEGKGVFSKRSRARAILAFESGHFEPGNRLAREVSDQLSEPYAFQRLLFDSRYTYGASGARGNFSFGLRANSLDHSNEPNPDNRQRTDGLDFTRITPSAVFSVRVSGDTRVFLDVRAGTADYSAFNNPETPELDHFDFRAYIGTSWELTGRTGGSIGVGLIDIDYDDNELNDDELLGVDIDAFYEFTSYSKLQIGVRREQDTTTDNNLLGRKDSIDLQWNHDWSSRFRSEIGFESITSIGSCAVAGTGGSIRVEREFTQTELSVGFSLQVRRWLSFGLGFDLTDENADACASDQTGTFEQQKVLASVKVTL